jgi:hypothetical protein
MNEVNRVNLWTGCRGGGSLAMSRLGNWQRATGQRLRMNEVNRVNL